ncbi:MAG: FAA hydrolase family protein, partial [Betaproteobacteria bacterium]|nr:FAA hydrolase family protein [Betaproteobacteria bacterium]
MSQNDRRDALKTGAVAAMGAIAGCALPGGAASDTKVLFPIATTVIPVVG